MEKVSHFLSGIECDKPKNLLESHPDLSRRSPFQLWELLFCASIMNLIVSQTKTYARREKNNSDFEVSHGEIRAFLGIILLSGYHKLPHEQHYWSSQPDLGVKIVTRSMSRQRFNKLKTVLHFADNQNLPPGDKLAEIRRIYTSLNKNLVKYGIFHEKLSIDESMVPYYGRHSAKMFIKGKPIRFGYKLWGLCGNDGYPYRLELYSGKQKCQRQLPWSTLIVEQMADKIISHSSPTEHEVFFDNFFTSSTLLRSLAEKKIKATGTIREARTGGVCNSMKSNAAMIKLPRGTFDYRSDGHVYVCKWHDNSIVNIASNYQSHIPVKNTTRRVRGASSTKVKQPCLIRTYNEGMGGVDVMDRLLAAYRPSIRGKQMVLASFH